MSVITGPSAYPSKLIAVQHLGVEHELFALRRRHGGDDTNLAAELVRRADSASLVRHRQTFLDQRDELFLSEPLAPARHRRSIERQAVAEAQFAAEVLE